MNWHQYLQTDNTQYDLQQLDTIKLAYSSLKHSIDFLNEVDNDDDLTTIKTDLGDCLDNLEKVIQTLENSL